MAKGELLGEVRSYMPWDGILEDTQKEQDAIIEKLEVETRPYLRFVLHAELDRPRSDPNTILLPSNPPERVREQAPQKRLRTDRERKDCGSHSFAHPNLRLKPVHQTGSCDALLVFLRGVANKRLIAFYYVGHGCGGRFRHSYSCRSLSMAAIVDRPLHG